MIEKVCTMLTDKIAGELKMSKDERDVIHYGLFAIIHTSISIIAIIIVGALLGVLIPSLILSLTTVILRKYSGGAHASTPESCAIIGVIISVGGGWAATQIRWSLLSVAIGAIVIFIFGFYQVYKLAPVDSPAKPIKKLEKQKTLKKKSILTLSIYCIGVVFLLGLYLLQQSNIILIWTICICLGVLWQVFSLTSLGHITVEKIDLFLIYTILRNKGEEAYEKD